MDVLSLDKDDTHDVQLCLDNDAGLVRLLVTVSDTRLTTDNQQQNQPTSPSVERRRPSDRSTAVQLYNVLHFVSRLLVYYAPAPNRRGH